MLAVATMAAAAPCALPASAAAVPEVTSLGFDRPATVGSQVTLLVGATDSSAPLSGLVTVFGPGEVFASSACRPPGSDGLAPGGPFAPGAQLTLAAPHTYRRAGTHLGLLRLDSGGCGPPATGLLQPFTATTTQPGEPPPPVERGEPTPVPQGGVPLPPMPGVGDLPGQPTAPAPPEPPAPPAPPEVGAARASAAKRAPSRRARRARGVACAGAASRIGRSAAALEEGRAALLCLLNSARRKRGLRPLRSNPRLETAAADHSRAMVRRGFFSHYNPNPGKRTLVDRLRRVRYIPTRRAWTVGENIGYGARELGTPRGVLRAWMRSTPHRANILHAEFREVGLGIHPGCPRSPRRGATYTTDFGTKD
jgi:uncharacterized protein YkwD